MRTVTPLMKTDIIKLGYFAYLRLIMSYAVVFWENSTDGKKGFNIQKNTTRIVACITKSLLYWTI
jgi:hypothetical protein